MPTLSEEIFSRHAGRQVRAGELVLCDVDFVMSHDNTTPIAIKSFEQMSEQVWDPSKMGVFFDHIYPAATVVAAENQRMIVDFLERQGCRRPFTEGVSHQVMIEKGFCRPGDIVIGADSHSCSYGAMGAFGTGMGSTDIAVAWATGKNWFKVPETLAIRLEGELQPGVYTKDVMLKIVQMIGADGARYMAVEFIGSFVEGLDISGRTTLCSMGVEMGAKASMVEADETTWEYLRKIPNLNFQIPNKSEIRNSKHEFRFEDYARVVELDVSTVAPQVAKPHQVDQVVDVTEVLGIKLDQVFLGTCTNGRLEDFKIFAEILKGKKIHPKTRAIAVPSSKDVHMKAMAAGYIEILMDAGVDVGPPGCGPCIGRHMGVLGPGEVALTTMNRNFMGRMGSPESQIYLASPATVAVSALAGEITDPRGNFSEVKFSLELERNPKNETRNTKQIRNSNIEIKNLPVLS